MQYPSYLCIRYKDNGSLNFEFGKIMAQAWLEETLPEVVVSSSQKTTCPNCYMSVEKWCFQTHLELDCPKRTVVCGFCNQSYIFYEGHTCTTVCAFCHKPSYECTCEGALGIGHYHSGGPSGGGGGGTGPHTGGSSSPGGNHNNSESPTNSVVSKAADYATQHAYSAYVKDLCGHCARAVRRALENAGFVLSSHPNYATNYGPILIKLGFTEISKAGYSPEKGDIRVWRPRPKQDPPAGHIDIYNGKNWVSDYIQRGEYPGKAYQNVSYKIYRKK